MGAHIMNARAYDHGDGLGEDGQHLYDVQYVREERPFVGAHDRPDDVLAHEEHDQTDLHHAEYRMQVRRFETRQFPVAGIVIVQTFVF